MTAISFSPSAFCEAMLNGPFGMIGWPTPCLMLQHLAQKFRQEGGVSIEDRRDVGDPGTGLVLIHQGFIGADAQLLGLGLGAFAEEVQHRLELRLHQLKSPFGRASRQVFSQAARARVMASTRSGRKAVAWA